MKRWLNKYFDFTKGELNGLLVLIFLTIMVMVYPHVYRMLKTEPPVNEEEQLAILKLSIAKQQQEEALLATEDLPQRHQHKHTINRMTLFNFDPNLIGLSDWQKLGLSLRQAQAILNYRNKGGKFYKKEDLKKMYTISAEIYEVLAPYVHLPINSQQTANAGKPSFTAKVQQALTIVEINAADTSKLDLIRGIGITFATRIIKYRERIGGFYKKEQLMEVFGLDSAKYLEIKDQIRVDESLIRKIDVNKAEMAEFKHNPYIHYKQANAIIQYRKQHGNYKELKDLLQVAILTPETIELLKPYLTFEP